MFLQGFLETDYGAITSNPCSALLAGGILGLERSFHGRPAGFRTHALVCLPELESTFRKGNKRPVDNSCG